MTRIYRLSTGEAPFYAAERDGGVHRLTMRGATIFDGYDLGPALPGGLSGARVLAPVRPSKIVCVGLNYRDHALEVGKALPAEPLLFIKPSTAVIDPEDTILLPPGVGRVDYEGEFAAVIGRRAHRVSRAEALSVVMGFTCVN